MKNKIFNKIALYLSVIGLIGVISLCGYGKARATNVTAEENTTEITTEENVGKYSNTTVNEVVTEAISEEESREETTEESTEAAVEITSVIATVIETKAEQASPRIVATSSAICDIMDRLNIDLVGVPQTSSISSKYEKVVKVGSPMTPDMEIIKSLKPTEVFTPDTLEGDLKIKYDNIGVKSTFINLRSVKGLYEGVRLIGDKYGREKEAEKLIKEYEAFISQYNNSHKGEKPKALVLVGLPGSYLVATPNSYVGSLVELAGGENVFQHAEKDFLNINPEEMLLKQPDVIIRTAHGLPDEALKMFEKEFNNNAIWKHFKAVKENRVYDVDYRLFGMSASFDYPQALMDLEPILYGE